MSCLLTAPQPMRHTVIANASETVYIRQFPTNTSVAAGCVPLINGGGRSQVNGDSDGVPKRPQRKTQSNVLQNWMGEQGNPRTQSHVARNPEFPVSIWKRPKPLLSTHFSLVPIINPEVLARRLIGTWVRCKTL